MKTRIKRLLYIFLASLILPFTNEKLWAYSGIEFWIYYSILFGIVLILLLIMYFTFWIDLD